MKKDLRDHIFKEAVNRFMTQAIASTLMSYSGVLLICWKVFEVYPKTTVLAWAMSMGFLVAINLLFIGWYKKNKHLYVLAFRYQLFLMAIRGLGWGSVAWLFLDPNYINESYFVIIVLVCIASGSALPFSVVPWVYPILLLTTFLPMISTMLLYFDNNAHFLSLTAGFSVYMIILFVYYFKGYRISQNGIALSINNAILAKEVEEKNKELTLALEHIHVLACTDSLTGILNRRAFVDQLKVYTQPEALLIMDIDHFKAINDQYGHITGDKVIQETAARIAAILPPNSLFARYGGEEFIIVYHSGVEFNAEHIIDCVANTPYTVEHHSIHVTTSVGVAFARADESMDTWIKRADDALYRAKHSGRNQACVANGEHFATSVRN